MGDHPEPENSSLIDDVTSGIMSKNMSNAFATKRIAIQLAKYCLPMLILSGTIGNALSFIVLLRKRMRSTSIYVYLLCLACVDMLVLYTSAFKTWIRILTDFEFLHQSGFTCKTTMFVLLVSQHMSAWLIVVVTFDRFVAVWLPFRATTICSVSKAKMVTLLLFITLVIYNVHVFCTIDLRSIDVNQRRQFCGARKNRYMREMFNYVNFATYSVIPFVIVLILNIGIIIKVSRSAPHINGELAIRSNDAAVEKQQRQQRVTYMLLTVSFTFILLTGPFTLHSLIVKDTKDVNQQARNLLSKTICFMLMYANHSVNFYLYCVTGKKFRNEFIDTFSVCFRDNRIVRRRSSNRTFRTPIGRCPSPHNDALALNIPPNRLPVEVVELEENLAVQ